MKVEIECLSCLLQRGYLQIVDATTNQKLQFEAASQLLRYLANEFGPAAVAAILGTTRDRIIKHVSGNLDIYAKRKRASNQAALALLPTVASLIRRQPTLEKKFRKACLAAIAGNTIEFDIPEHKVNLNDLAQLIRNAEEDLVIDDISEIYREVKKSDDILYLTDNAGEIAFDKLLINELKRLDSKVTVVVKGGAILNDATLDDAKTVSMYEVADVIITTGTDAVGVPIPEERSREFTTAYENAEFIIAKGMGNAETLTEMELKQPHAFLLRTKCNPVANYFGVERGKNIARLVRP